LSPGRRLASPTPPWVHLLVSGDGVAALPPVPHDFVARAFDGRRCRTKRALLDEMARVLDFPLHFGRTWDALEDCLTDLGWMPGAGYQLVVSSADRLLTQNSADYATFVALLQDVGRAWGTGATGHPGRGAVPFHTVLVVSAARLSKRRNWGVPPLAG
jgi:RNAse (barnase) inhibitor barstar